MSRDGPSAHAPRNLRRRRLASALAGLAAALLALPSHAHTPHHTLADLEVYDRADGTSLSVYEHEGRRYVVGTPGHEYQLRIRNLTAGRILAVTSVDGVNVVSGDTAAPDQTGYVIGPYGSVEISGWRKSTSRVAAFYFTDLGDSYAARTGRPGNVGVIGVAVFREAQAPAIPTFAPRAKIAEPDAPAARGDARERADIPIPAPPVERAAAPRAESSAGAAGNAAPYAPAPSASEPSRDARADGRLAAAQAPRPTASPLGTGHGRSESSVVTYTAFERASRTPDQLVSVQYDRRETLAALGIVPGPRYARRDPDAFPATRFAPDPR